jgi:tryptophanase
LGLKSSEVKVNEPHVKVNECCPLIPGYEIVEEPPSLRHFSATLKPVVGGLYTLKSG